MRIRRYMAVVAGGYAVLCLGFASCQTSLIYFPGAPPTRMPLEFGMAYEEVWLEADDGVRLHAWWLPAGDAAARGAVLVCHGNAGHIGHRLGLAQAFLDMGLDVLLFDYRGFGLSEGSPGEEGIYLDAEAAYAHLVDVRGIEPARIVVFGRSLGAAVGIELAARRDAAALVAEAGFTSMADMGAALYPWLPVRTFLMHRYEALERISDVDEPILVVHSPGDTLVPVEHALALHGAASSAELLMTTGNHNDGGFNASAAGRAAVRAFIERHL